MVAGLASLYELATLERNLPSMYPSMLDAIRAALKPPPPPPAPEPAPAPAAAGRKKSARAGNDKASPAPPAVPPAAPSIEEAPPTAATVGAAALVCWKLAEVRALLLRSHSHQNVILNENSAQENVKASGNVNLNRIASIVPHQKAQHRAQEKKRSTRTALRSRTTQRNCRARRRGGGGSPEVPEFAGQLRRAGVGRLLVGALEASTDRVPLADLDEAESDDEDTAAADAAAAAPAGSAAAGAGAARRGAAASGRVTINEKMAAGASRERRGAGVGRGAPDAKRMFCANVSDAALAGGSAVACALVTLLAPSGDTATDELTGAEGAAERSRATALSWSLLFVGWLIPTPNLT